MLGSREHVEQGEAARGISGGAERLQIAGKRRGIAGDIETIRRVPSAERGDDVRVAAGARGIQDDKRLFRPAFCQLLREDLLGQSGDCAASEALHLMAVVCGRGCRQIAFDEDPLGERLVPEREREGADAAVGVDERVGLQRVDIRPASRPCRRASSP